MSFETEGTTKEQSKAFFRSIQFKQGVVFTLTIAFFSVLLYFWIVYSIYQQQVREELAFLNHKLIGYYAYYQTETVNLFVEHIRKDLALNSQRDLFIRLVSSNGHELYYYYPSGWQSFDYTALYEPEGLKKEYVTLTGPRKDFLLVATQINLKDGAYLQGGISTETREKLFTLYRNSYGRTLPLLLILSFIVGTMTTSRALNPLKKLNREILEITKTREISRRLSYRESGDQLDRLSLHINHLLERIEDLIEELKTSMDSAAHDLRTPLTRLSGRIEVALLDPEITVDELKDVLAETINDSQHILKIFNTLMNISESEKGLIESMESFSLEEVILEISDLYGLVAEEKDVKIVLDLHPLLRTFVGNRLRIKQALSNLVDNGVKYSDPGEEVTIRLTGGKGGITLEVENKGPFISEEDKPRIWNRFYRGDKSRHTEGLGLGLSLVKAVVDSHQGSVDMLSEGNGLTCFIINLPFKMQDNG